MGLRYIFGSSDSEKTKFCLDEMTGRIKDDSKSNFILIVPEQYSLQAEKNLVKSLQGNVVLQSQVLSFQRLAYYVFSEVGGVNKKILEDIGRNMLLRKILFENKKELTFYHKSIDKQGFLEQLGVIMEEFFKYKTNFESLEASIAVLENQTLKAKLQDLYLIYKKYTEFIRHEYISQEQNLDILAEKIKLSPYIKNAEIWIDGFTGFTPQEFKVIEMLLQHGKRVSLTMSIKENDKNIREGKVWESDPFYEIKLTIRKIDKIVAVHGTKLEPTVFLTNESQNDLDELSFLQSHYFTYPFKTFDRDCNKIKVVNVKNRYAEVMEVAKEITKLVREGFRYNEIAIITNALSEYEKNIITLFKQFDIPFFMDTKKDIRNHPLCELILALLEMVTANISYESVFRFLKTNLTEMEREDVDILENYALAYGIRGKKWFSAWTYGGDDYNLDDINFFRMQFLEMVMPFLEAIKTNKKYTVKYISVKIYELLKSMDVTAFLENHIEKMKLKGFKIKATESQQIWDKVTDVFEKIVAILGEEEVTVSEYAKILEAGFSKMDMGAIPPTIDQVMIGDLSRSRLPEIKVLFIVGVNDGIIPKRVEDKSLVTDTEKEIISELNTGMAVSPTTKQRVFEEQFLIYAALSKPTAFLHISYPLSDLSGKAMRPSILLSKLAKMFPQLKEKNADFLLENEMDMVIKPLPTFSYLIKNLKKFSDEKQFSEVTRGVYKWYRENGNESFQLKLARTEQAIFRPSDEQYLAESSIKRMYGNEIFTSVSRLEKFISCPFSYFVQYGLHAKQRRLYQISTPDLGSLFHDILADFSQALTKNNQDFKSIERKQLESIIETTVDNLAPKMGNEILTSSPKYQYLIKKLKRISKRAVWALCEHAKKGEFSPLGFEIGFGINEALPPIVIELASGEKIILTGRIDRIDVMDAEDNVYVKIIDYKSGKKAFSFQDIYYGLQLQLLLYLDSFLKSGKKMVKGNLLPGGVFYFRIDDPFISIGENMDMERIEQKILKELKLSGLVLADQNIVKSLDKDITASSDIIPVGINKDGSFSKYSSVMDLEGFEKLMKHVNTIIKDVGGEILKGNIKISPFKEKNITGCTYCIYNSICQFDPVAHGSKYNVLTPLKKEDVLKKLT